MVEPTLRQAWAEIVTGDDYEAHMASVGQAQANADLVQSLLAIRPPPGPRLLFAGAGTGQMLDFVPPAFLERREALFTDINARFLDRLQRRLGPGSPHRTAVDDLEDTRLEGPFDAAIIMLVFEHIDWRKGVASLVRLRPAGCYIVIQENPPGMPSRPLPGSLKVLEQARPALIGPDALVRAMESEGYALAGREVRTVLDGKKMIGLVFEPAQAEMEKD